MLPEQPAAADHLAARRNEDSRIQSGRRLRQTAQAVVAIWETIVGSLPALTSELDSDVKAPLFSITGDGIEYFGAYRPVWRQDGLVSAIDQVFAR